jgi:hypothetical protein
LQTHGAVLQIHGLGQEINANGRLVVSIEIVVHEACDDAGFTNGLVPEKDQFVFGQGCERRVAASGGSGTARCGGAVVVGGTHISISTTLSFL